MGRDELVWELFEHASALGVERGYWDVLGQWHEPSVEAVLAVLGSLGAPVASLEDVPGSLREHVVERETAVLPPVVTSVGGGRPVVDLCFPRGAAPRAALARLTAEDGEQRRWEIAPAELPVVADVERGDRGWTRHRLVLDVEPLPVGYHELELELGDELHAAAVLAAPLHVVQPGPTTRAWGVLAPLYSLRTETGIGADVSDLDVLGALLHEHGATLVATLPLLAAFLDEPYEPSPYAPVSRQFWNELYLDVERLPELSRSPAARALLDSPPVQAEIAALRALPRFDAARQARLVTGVLDELTTTFFAQPVASRADFDRWVADDPLVVEYGRFRAAVERSRAGWRSWPDASRHGRLLPADYDRRVAARHVYAQWAMHRQLAGVAEVLDARGQSLYLDLPVGSSADGFDTWIDQDAYGWGTSVGAPPDEFFASGQSWGFPPMRPDEARRAGHRAFAASLRHHMTHAGMVRIDHVMGLHRLFWVPDGMDPTQGVYVRSSADEQFAVLAIESHRAGCVVVGEDLGTVPDEVREAMERHRVLRSYVAEFNLPSGPGLPLVEPQRTMVATVDTHDTPTFASFVEGRDLRTRRAMGLLGTEEAGRELRARQKACDGLVAALELRGYLRGPGDAGSTLRALLELLADSDAPAVLLTFDDLLGVTEPHNLPGTGDDRPNWVLRLPEPLTALAAAGDVAAALRSVQRRRLDSRARAVTSQQARSAGGESP